MSKRVPVLPGIQPSTSAYSQVVEANGFVFVAGQVGNDMATGEVVPGGIEAETRALFANIERCLAAVGLGLGDIVKTTVYLVDMDDWAAYNDVFRELFPVDPPTRATVAVAGLVPPFRIEAEVIATR
jgi:2-iminobutanoate/2-iminopropanoate deaminase